MRDKIRELIKSSHVIKDSEKALYSKLLDFIDEENQKQLLEILESEVKGTVEIEKDSFSERSDINQNFIEKIDDFFKVEEKKAIQSEEKEEQDQGENILKQLDE